MKNIKFLQDELKGALIGLARAVEGNKATNSTHYAMIEGLYYTIADININSQMLKEHINVVRKEKEKLIPRCKACSKQCGRNDDYKMEELFNIDKDIRELKLSILFGIKEIVKYAHYQLTLGHIDERINNFFYKSLLIIGNSMDKKLLLSMISEMKKINMY